MMTLAPKMEDLQVARVYAQAVWQAGENQATRNEILEEVDGVIDVANSSDDIRSLLFSNTFGPERRGEILNKAFGNRVNPVVKNLLDALNRRNRMSLLSTVSLALHQLDDQAKGIQSVVVKSAIELPADVKTKVVSSLERTFKIKANARFEVAPDILGGLWIKVGDTVYNDTVAARLSKLKDNILARKSHEI